MQRNFLASRAVQFLLLAVFVATLGACGDNKSSPQPAAEVVQRGGTLMAAMDQAPVVDRFDPMKSNDRYTTQVSQMITEGLVIYDAKLEIQPWLAERYEISPDGLTYTFHLRKGIKFHDGTEMDANAVKFSVDRVRDEKNKQWPKYSDGQLIADTQTSDKYTFKIVLKEASAAFLSRLTGGLGAVISQTALETMGEDAFGRAPVGTGPFAFGEYKADNYVRLTRFDGYWRPGADGQPLPYLDAVEWRIIAEPALRLTALQAGDVDVVQTVRDQDVALIKADANLVYAQQPSLGYTGFSFNLQVPPFDNVALRQAIQYAINREELVTAVYEGNREVGYIPISRVNQWAVDPNYKPYTFDQTKAKQKLAEGGKPDGFEFTAFAASGNSITQQLYELMQAQMAKVGIKMRIELVDFNSQVVTRWQRNDPEGNVYAVSFSNQVDPDAGLTNGFTKGGSSNNAKYENARFDELIIAARKTTDKEQRGNQYKAAMKILMEDSPYVVTSYGVDRYVGQQKVKGWHVGNKDTVLFSEYWLAR